MRPLTTILLGLISAFIGSAATIAVGVLGYWNNDRTHDIEMVRISLSILSGENKDTSIYGRKFALRALKEYTVVDIPDDEFEAWASTGTIPDEGWALWGTGNYVGGKTMELLSVAPKPEPVGRLALPENMPSPTID